MIIKIHTNIILFFLCVPLCLFFVGGGGGGRPPPDPEATYDLILKLCYKNHAVSTT
jgi:hypothetical protein